MTAAAQREKAKERMSNRQTGANRKRGRSLWILFLPLAALSALYLELRFYTVHVDAGTGAWVIACVFSAVLAVVFIRALLKKRYSRAALALASLAVCAAVICIAQKIPNGPVCDGITGEELGLMGRWFDIGP